MKYFPLTQAEWTGLWIETPLGISKADASTKAGAFVTPGCCVKSIKREQGGLSADYGRLHKFNHNEVIVISHSDRIELHPDKSLAKWVGTEQEYREIWECD